MIDQKKHYNKLMDGKSNFTFFSIDQTFFLKISPPPEISGYYFFVFSIKRIVFF